MSKTVLHSPNVLLADTTGLAGGSGGNQQPQTPRRYLAYMACFSRKHSMRQIYDFLNLRLRINKEDIRLWKLKDEVRGKQKSDLVHLTEPLTNIGLSYLSYKWTTIMSWVLTTVT